MKTFLQKIAAILITMAPALASQAQMSDQNHDAATILKLKEDYTLPELRGELRNRAVNLKSAGNFKKTLLQQSSTTAVYAAFIELQKVIYETDDRTEALFSPPPMHQNINKVAGFFFRENVRVNQDGSVSLIGYKSFKDRFELCPSERFLSQPSIAYCTGFAVSENIIVSAGHCIQSGKDTLEQSDLDNFVIIFGYYQANSGPILKFDAKDVYYPVKAIKKLEQGVVKGQDYLLVKVDRPVPVSRIVELSDQPIQAQQHVYVIGHPCGLPMKCADSAFVRNNSYPNCFIANLDTYGGNSGSPVFNADNNKVEGILVRGNQDFEVEGSCQRSTICGNNDCTGEDVTRTSIFLPALKAFSH